MLLIVDEYPSTELLSHVSDIKDRLQAELEIYCPMVVPRARHSELTPETARADMADEFAREEGRRLAGSIISSLSERNVDAHVETSICHSMTDSVINAIARAGPDLVVLPRSEKGGLLDRPFSLRLEEIWSQLDVPLLIVEPRGTPCEAVLGLVSVDSRRRGSGNRNERVVRTTLQVAQDFRLTPHLLATVRPRALELAKEAMAPRSASGAGRRESAAARALFELADDYGIPHEQAHLHPGDEAELIGRLVEPMGIGLVVASVEPARRLGGLLRRQRPIELVADLPCDLLIIGESHVPHARS